jgi:hypothetical protein
MKSKMANGNKFTMETFSDNENVTIEKTRRSRWILL